MPELHPYKRYIGKSADPRPEKEQSSIVQSTNKFVAQGKFTEM